MNELTNEHKEVLKEVLTDIEIRENDPDMEDWKAENTHKADMLYDILKYLIDTGAVPRAPQNKEQ